MRWIAFLLLPAVLLLAVACSSATVVTNEEPVSSSSTASASPAPTPHQTAGASWEDRVQAWSPFAAVVMTPMGFLILLATFIGQRNRQRLEIEAYLRVDLGGVPRPGEWVTDFKPPGNVAYVSDQDFENLGDAYDKDPMIAMWIRNQQTHPMGFALGIGAEVEIKYTDKFGDTYKKLLKPRFAYLEPQKCVQVILVRFPRDWRITATLKGVEQRSVFSDARKPRHGRWRCTYDDRQFESTPISDPPNFWYDKVVAAAHAVRGVFRRQQS